MLVSKNIQSDLVTFTDAHAQPAILLEINLKMQHFGVTSIARVHYSGIMSAHFRSLILIKKERRR